MSKNKAHELNLDAAQREIDARALQGEDMSGATIAADYSTQMTHGQKAAAPKAPRASKKARDLAAAEAKTIQDILDLATVHTPSKEQLDAEEAACKAEEAANLAAEQEAFLAAPLKQVYGGPMTALRDRSKKGLYTRQPNGQPACGDEIATILGVLTPAQVIRACITAMDLPGNPYLHLNIGQQSMNLRNKLRGAMKRGEFGMGVVREAAEDEIEALTATFAAAREARAD
jgi:hypothetical protein